MAMELTFPVTVTESNIEYLKGLILNGKSNYPGAASVLTKEGEVFQLRNIFI